MAVSAKVMRLLYRFQRTEVRQADRTPCSACDEAHGARLDYFIQRDEPIQFVLPAFPAKSPNRSKVLGSLPDLGELLALTFLQRLCDYVGYFYRPGATVTICSDGHVFGDVVGVSDADVTEYRHSLTGMIETANCGSLNLYGLDDAFGGHNYPKLRETLEADYAPSISQLKESARTDKNVTALFNGIHRFMFEDAVGTKGDGVSRSALRRETKETAYQTISRSNAWSSVVAERFPNAMRLSIHPQPPHSEKVGIQLLSTPDSWLTPWHGCVLDDGSTRSLVKRWRAEELDASIVWRHGRPSHFVGPHLSIEP